MHTFSKLTLAALLGTILLTGCSATTGGSSSGDYNYYKPSNYGYSSYDSNH